MTDSAFTEALSRWRVDVAVVRRRWHALWLATQGWPAARVAAAL